MPGAPPLDLQVMSAWQFIFNIFKGYDMGLKQGTGGKGRLFLSINGKDGRISQSEKDAAGSWHTNKCDAGATIEGTVVGISTKEDSVNGQAITKGILHLRDAEPNQPDMQVEFGLWRQNANTTDPQNGVTSRFGLGILAGLNAADLTKPIVLRPWMMEKGTAMPDGTPRTSDGAGTTFYQGGNKLSPAFIENGQVVEKLAPLPSQVFAGQTHYDKSGWDKVGQDLFAAIEAKLYPADAESAGDHDDAINPAEAAQAANSQPERQRA